MDWILKINCSNSGNASGEVNGSQTNARSGLVMTCGWKGLSRDNIVENDIGLVKMHLPIYQLVPDHLLL